MERLLERDQVLARCSNGDGNAVMGEPGFLTRLSKTRADLAQRSLFQAPLDVCVHCHAYGFYHT